MSLFNTRGKDAALPILSQFYQLRSEEEITAWYARVSGATASVPGLIALHGPLTRLMLAVATRTEGCAPDVAALEGLIVAGGRPFFEGLLAQEDGKAVLRRSESPSPCVIAIDLIVAFREAARATANNPNGLGALVRCDECGSVFVLRRPGIQKFCSNRCAARQGKRERMRAIRKTQATLTT